MCLQSTWKVQIYQVGSHLVWVVLPYIMFKLRPTRRRTPVWGPQTCPRHAFRRTLEYHVGFRTFRGSSRPMNHWWSTERANTGVLTATGLHGNSLIPNLDLPMSGPEVLDITLFVATLWGHSPYDLLCPALG
jgi:hypothetical protein